MLYPYDAYTVHVGPLKRGVCILFGSELWKVLEVDREKREILILCLDNVAVAPFDSDAGGCWQNSEIRLWLNTIYADNFFSEKEREAVVPSDTSFVPQAKKLKKYKNRTTDDFFLLSSIEAAELLPSAFDKQTGGWWWLRFCELTGSRPITVDERGMITYFHPEATLAGGIRPACRISMDSEYFQGLVDHMEGNTYYIRIPGLFTNGDVLTDCNPTLPYIEIPEEVNELDPLSLSRCMPKVLSLPESLLSSLPLAFASLRGIYARDLVLVLRNGSEQRVRACYIKNEENNFDQFEIKDQSYDMNLLNNWPGYRFSKPVRAFALAARLAEDPGIGEIMEEKIVAMVRKRLDDVVAFCAMIPSPQVVQALFDHGVITKKNEEVFRESLRYCEAEPVRKLADYPLNAEKKKTDPLAKEYNTKFKEIGGNPFIRQNLLQGYQPAPLYWKDGTRAPDELFYYLLAVYGVQKEARPVPEADEAAAKLRYDSFQEAIEKLVEQCKPGRYPGIIPFLCRYGSGVLMKKLDKSWRSWHGWKRYGQKGRSAQFVFIQHLVLTDTRTGIAILYERGMLEEYAEARDLPVSEVIASKLLDLGAGEDGCRYFDLGTTSLQVRFVRKDRFELSDTKKMKRVSRIPKAKTDPALSMAAEHELKDMEEARGRIFEDLKKLIYRLYLDQYAMEVEQFKRCFLYLDLYEPAVKNLVWQQGEHTFLFDGSSLVDRDGKEYVLGEEPVTLASVLDLQEEELGAWREFLKRHRIEQPIRQIMEPRYDFHTIKPERYAQYPIDEGMLALGGHIGIRVEESVRGYFYLKDYELLIRGFSIKAQLDQNDRFTINEIDPMAFDRQTNAVIAYLDSLTVGQRIRKDDVTVLEHLECYSAEELEKMTAAAIEAKAALVGAALIDYRNKTEAEYDPSKELAI